MRTNLGSHATWYGYVKCDNFHFSIWTYDLAPSQICIIRTQRDTSWDIKPDQLSLAKTIMINKPGQLQLLMGCQETAGKLGLCYWRLNLRTRMLKGDLRDDPSKWIGGVGEAGRNKSEGRKKCDQMCPTVFIHILVWLIPGTDQQSLSYIFISSHEIYYFFSLNIFLTITQFTRTLYSIAMCGVSDHKTGVCEWNLVPTTRGRLESEAPRGCRHTWLAWCLLLEHVGNF